MRVFLDSSAYAKRYIAEVGTTVVVEWCERAQQVGLAVVALPELFSAFNRLRREAALSSVDYDRVKGLVLDDMGGVELCDPTPAIIRMTLDLLEAHPLRALDAIHLASALEWQAEMFVSADIRQCRAARGEGLTVVEV